MAELRKGSKHESGADLIIADGEGQYTNLVCDDVIVDWLMNLEAEDSAADLVDARRSHSSHSAYC